ncbi:TolC family protein [Fulvivirga lutimaris]|uniref:TolC family protein n=1 Tax=Fulvivirga lutimaris TaxID=1819566 RepID=UPI0012BC1698|nr:TolC family protein [Fulvivirga lutimaris]MTI38413.1 TolC family protein [Fulvivirga lutimaris]
MRNLVFIFLFASAASYGQVADDSVRVLSFDDFYQIVIQNHPIIKQAELLSQAANQELRLARGAFDPKLEGTWNMKDLSDTEYYNLLDVSLKIPTWFPVDPKVGFSQNTGEYLNPENFISNSTDNQQLYAGVSVPIGKGLFIDSRRATLRQAQLMQDMAEAEQIKEINKILLNAVKDYWEWYAAVNKFELMQQSIDIADDIFSRTKMAFEYGEAAPLDTIQAKITLLGRKTALQEAMIERIKAGLTLSNHLWTQEGAPLEMTPNVKPAAIQNNRLSDVQLGTLYELAKENHPELRKLNLKNESLLIDKRLAVENLKPRLDLNYYFLDQPINAQGNSNDFMFLDNYKVGVDFAFPIFLRKERAKLGMTKLKITENNYQLDYTERQILNDLSAQYNEMINLQQIVVQQQEMADSYQLILQAERLNLENGESDLFKLNIQIDKLIEAQSKLIKTKVNYQKSIATLYWAAGISNLGLVD